MTTRVEISKKILLINSVSTAMRRLLSLTVLVWLHQHLASNIPTQEYKIFALVASTLLVVPVLTLMCASGMRRYAINAYARGDAAQVTKLASTITPILVLVSLGTFALGGLFAWNVSSILNITPVFEADAQIMFGLLTLSAGTRVILMPFGIGFDIRQKFLMRSFIGLGAEVFRIALLLLLLNSVSIRALWVMVSLVSAALLELGVIAIISMKLVPALRIRLGLFSRELVKPLMSFGGWAVLNQLAFLAREVADPYILDSADPDGNNTMSYYFGSLADRRFRQIYLDAYSTALPAVTAMDATEQHQRLRRTTFRMTRLALWILLSAGMPLIVFREELFRLYLPGTYSLYYGPAGTVMGLMLARYLFVFPNATLGMLAVAKAKMRPLALRSATLALVNLCLTLYLVVGLGMGAAGAALAAFAVTVAGCPVAYWTLGLKLSEAKLGPWLKVSLWRGLLPALCALPVWLGLSLAFPPDRWRWVILEVLAGSIVYFGVLFSVAMTERDREDFGAVTAKLRKYVPILRSK